MSVAASVQDPTRTRSNGQAEAVQVAAVQRIRNLAIVAHIDHGKTTLIDAIFRAARLFRENQQVAERVMDSYDLERERGITIRAKHCSVEWQGYLINIVDTPGHADFSGEVERILSMVDSVLLLVDANEGPMPQTRYVLMRALRLGMRPVVVINKVDRPRADPYGALDKTFDLFLELGATDEQADFPVLFGSALEGWMVRDLERDPERDPERHPVRKPELGPEHRLHPSLEPLFETIVAEVPPPPANLDAPFRMQISTLAWSDYLGRIGCGRVLEGTHRRGEALMRTVASRTEDGGWTVIDSQSARSAHLWVTRGLERVEVEEVYAGDIVWINGPDDLCLGDTLSAPELVDPALPPLDIEEPTVSMFFLVNNSPFAGREGQAVTLRQIKERLEREARVNAALRVEDLGRPDGVKVSGRGELHLGILLEEMRREGMELCVSRPEVITRRDREGNLLEPLEELTVEVPEEFQGVVIEKLAQRKAEITDVRNEGTGVVRLRMTIPTRGLLGYRGEFLTDTRGLGLMASRQVGYGAWRGEMVRREHGSLVSMENGTATAYALENLQARGTLFLSPLDPVYAGMIVGEHSRSGDLACNPTKIKKLGNYRAETKEVNVPLKVPRRLTLDQALEWIADDELVEITPKSVRVRKAVLDAEERKKTARA